MSERFRQRESSSMSGANIEVDDPWLDDQTTTKYTRLEAPPATASHKSKPPWWRVLAACSAAAASLVLGQMLWAGRALPADAPARAEPDSSAAAQPESVRDVAVPPSPALIETSADPEPVPPPDARKRRDKTKTRLRKSSAAASGKPQDGLPATLNIDSQPWSEITIDSQPMGRTPQRGISLKPGKRKVLLRNPESDVTKILILHVLPGEAIERVEQLVQ